MTSKYNFLNKGPVKGEYFDWAFLQQSIASAIYESVQNQWTAVVYLLLRLSRRQNGVKYMYV